MKAAFFENGQVRVGEVADPTPSKGQALVRTHSCGLCASDVHFLHSGPTIIDISRKFGGVYGALDYTKPFVPGHEFVGEVLDYGAGSERRIKPGRKVTSIPIMRQGSAHAAIGFSHECPGGFGELMLLDEDFMLEVPSELDDDYAAMIEPLAVGLEHARMGRPGKDDVALVVGCGAIGLGVIAGLKLMDAGPIVAADFNASRRDIAIKMGADVALDPRETSPYAPLPDIGGRRVNLIYECVGLPGMLQAIIKEAPFGGRIVMGGYCMDEEKLYIFTAQNKRLNVQFAAGEEPQDMELALRAIADGRVDVSHWLGARIGLGEVGKSLTEMSSAAAPVRTVLDPRNL